MRLTQQSGKIAYSRTGLTSFKQPTHPSEVLASRSSTSNTYFCRLRTVPPFQHETWAYYPIQLEIKGSAFWNRWYWCWSHLLSCRVLSSSFHWAPRPPLNSQRPASPNSSLTSQGLDSIVRAVEEKLCVWLIVLVSTLESKPATNPSYRNTHLSYIFEPWCIPH